jgi:peptide/nickel transport system permease protein
VRAPGPPPVLSARETAMAIQAPPMSPAASRSGEPGDDAAPRRWVVSPLVGYYLKRIGLYLVTLWGALTASFLFFRLLPGDPVSGVIAQMQTQRASNTNIQANEAVVEFYIKQFGMDGSLWEQYVRYYQRVLLHFDFGPSILSYPTPSTELIARSLPWTIGLIGAATVIAWVFGVLIGALVGWKRRAWVSELITNACLLFSNIPAYFVALMLIIFFSYRWKLLPPTGAYNNRLDPGWTPEFIGSLIRYGTLPVLATAIVGMAGWILSTRALTVSILGEDYLTYANAKGLKPRRILVKHVLRNAWLPQIAALGISLGAVVSGNVLIERLFRYPGIGNLLVDSVIINDVNTAMAVVTMLIVLVLTINLAIDLLLPVIDPRVRAGDD